MRFTLNTNLRTLSLAGLVVVLSGCSLMHHHEHDSNSHTTTQASTSYVLNGSYDTQTHNQTVQPNNDYDASKPFKPVKHHKTLVNYVEQVALDLVDTLEYDTESDTQVNIAVSTLVNFDSSLNKSNQLGNQISETLIHQLQKFGYSVVDFKTTSTIDVNRRGDFVFSRNIKKLSEDHMASHILAGTLIYRQNGIVINTRIINVHTKQIVASSREFIPQYVLSKEDIYLSSN
ncbi:putative orphan protein [Alteromonadales bacterium TW-7]|nr:putative orphan protein [Alteromonadales bacterium TW-7]